MFGTAYQIRRQRFEPPCTPVGVSDYVVGSCSGNHFLGPGAAEQLAQAPLLTSVALEQQEGAENEQKCHPVVP